MNHSKVEIRFAVACILGYKEQANYIFENEFSNNQKECFIKYPIYNLRFRFDITPWNSNFKSCTEYDKGKSNLYKK